MRHKPSKKYHEQGITLFLCTGVLVWWFFLLSIMDRCGYVAGRFKDLIGIIRGKPWQ